MSPSLYPSPRFQITLVAPVEDGQPDVLLFADGETFQEPPLDAPPDFPSLDSALSRLHTADEAPPFSREGVDAVVMPRRNDSHPEPHLADETVRDDSEIVEVIKVRRASSAPEEDDPPAKPKPKSLRSRAGKAFRSIKNLARISSSSSSSSSSASRPAPYAPDTFAAASRGTLSSTATTPPPPPQPFRRGSVILANLFRPPSSTDAPVASSSLDLHALEHYSDATDQDEDERERQYDIDYAESVASRAPSPSPSTFTTTVRRRLSVLSFVRRSHKEPPRPASPPILSRGSTLPSSSTSSLPSTPTEDTYPLTLPSAKDSADDPDRTIGEMHEMRLDSLHFEALSFDAEQF